MVNSLAQVKKEMGENEVMDLLSATTIDNLRLSLIVDKLLKEKEPAAMSGNEEELRKKNVELQASNFQLTMSNIKLVKESGKSLED